MRSSSTSLPHRSLSTSFLTLLTVLALTSPTDAYFNRMMSCRQFCQMLAHVQIHQLWCIIDICRNQKLGHHVLRYAKRGPSLYEGNVGARRQIPPLSDVEKRVKEFWEGPAPADINN